MVYRRGGCAKEGFSNLVLDIFGKSLSKVLECKGARCDVAKVSDSDFEEKMLKAEIIISAVGKPHFITQDMIEENTIIIDIGTTKKGKEKRGNFRWQRHWNSGISRC